MKFGKLMLATGLALSLIAGCGGGGDGDSSDSSSNGNTIPTPNPGASSTVVLAANDLGMHCMDREFSVFSILPPFNVVRAQVLDRNAAGLPALLDDTRVDVRYDGAADADGSINTYSVNGPVAKTDFWTYAGLNSGQGLTGLYMPGDDPLNAGAQPMAYDPVKRWFIAEGIPITPVDDSGRTNAFGLMRISAADTGGQLSGHLDVVVPVAAETDCQACHKTGGMAAPGGGWSNAADLEVQSKINILRLHDRQEATNLEASRPVLCAQCHYSPALDLAGTGPTTSLPAFSRVVHAYHGNLKNNQGQPVFTATVDGNCYQCHPGRITQCLRGAMATAGMDCFDCHGDLASVGGDHPLASGGSIDGTNDGRPRRPWQDLPRCQSCHTGDAVSYLDTGSGLVRDGSWPFRLHQAYTVGDAAASPLAAPASRFSENNNALYRFSKGHGGIFCQGCHGSTHAVWPNIDPTANDNVAAVSLQGYPGVIKECSVCHAPGTLPLTTSGPHGLHNIGDSRWTSEDGHGSRYRYDKASCKACHGLGLNGTPLSRVSVDRSLRAEDHTVRFSAGDLVGCTHCHERPSL